MYTHLIMLPSTACHSSDAATGHVSLLCTTNKAPAGSVGKLYSSLAPSG